ncbi:MAG: SMC family ATPase [Clostridia bacterium]|nr:SMC family ATPase [Clostridia bacterium]
MKPVSLRLKNFGPFTSEQFIDFSKLEKSGLFLIYGNTGSGKTSLLDAICCALYCSSSNGVRYAGGGKAGFEKMRCQQAKDSEPTFVEYIFDNNNRCYRFYRELRLNRGGVNFNYEHFCGEYNGTGFVPLDSNLTMEKVNAFAEQIIGLTADQFRQVVILPQGKFEELLTSDSKSKEGILSGIFDVDKWDRTVGWINRKVTEDGRKLENERRSIDEKLGAYDCVSVSGLLEKSGQAEEEFKKTKAEEKTLAKEVEKLEEEKTELSRDDEKFRELDGRKKKFLLLSAEKANAEKETLSLNLAEQAEKIKPLFDKYNDSKNKATEAKRKLENAKKASASSEVSLAAAANKKEEHAGRKTENNKKSVLLTTYLNAVETYKVTERKKSALEKAEKVFRDLSAEYEAAEKAHTVKTEKCNSLKAAFEKADDELRRLRKAYDENIGSALAEKLVEGQPCPVCGSTTHPAPAKSAGEVVTKTDVDSAETARNTANEKYKSAQEEVGELKEKADIIKDKKSEAGSSAAAASAEYKSVLKGTFDDIPNLEQLNIRIAKLRKETEDYGILAETLEKAYTAAVAQHEKNQGLEKAASDEYAKASQLSAGCSAEWLGALEASPFESEENFVSSLIAPEEIRRRRQALTTLDANFAAAQSAVKEQEELLTGRERPDIEKHNEKLEAKKKELDILRKNSTLLCKAVEDMKKTYKELTKREELYAADIEKNGRQKQFYNLVYGKDGIGIKRYVLGVMLDLVTARANEMLGSIYGGRYRIKRSAEKTGRERIAGLAFEIEDLQCGKCRNSSDISGGEKFLVSLSLAIGLSDVVRARGGGINLEAIFIDEGFGTLDKECLGDAVFVLQAVRERNGMVGVISHVDELAENIPARIETAKSESGSTCEVFYE